MTSRTASAPSTTCDLGDGEALGREVGHRQAAVHVEGVEAAGRGRPRRRPAGPSAAACPRRRCAGWPAVCRGAPRCRRRRRTAASRPRRGSPRGRHVARAVREVGDDVLRGGGHVLAGRPVAAGGDVGRAPVLEDHATARRRRASASRASGWPGKRPANSRTPSSRWSGLTLARDSIGRAWRIARRAPTAWRRPAPAGCRAGSRSGCSASSARSSSSARRTWRRRPWARRGSTPRGSGAGRRRASRCARRGSRRPCRAP